MTLHRRLFTAALLSLSLCGCAQGDAPALLEDSQGNLEGKWRFCIDPHEVGEAQEWQNPGFDDSAWRTLTAPGYWEPQGITDTRPGEGPRPKNGMPWTDYDGAAWYRLSFLLPDAWEGQDLVLVLGSVDDTDHTYMNGALIGETGPGVARAVSVHRRYEVPAEALRFGETNVLAVRVVDGGGPGGLMGPTLSLLPRSILEAKPMLPQDDRPLAERFADPPASCRILKIVHAQPDSPEAQDSHIAALIAAGFGGMATNVAFDGYVESEPKWTAFLGAVKKAKEAGMCLWLYDELGYPSGTAGGIVMRDRPEWESWGLLIADAETQGDVVELKSPPGKLVLAEAYPVGPDGVDAGKAVDLSASLAEGVLRWEPPAGAWRVMIVTSDRIYEGTHAAVSLHENKPYINLLMAEPTARFIEVTHAEYARRMGADLSPFFCATFTDEPSLMSRFLRPMPYRVLPWSEGFTGEFRARRGYDLQPSLPLLIAEGPGSMKARYDFWQTVAELVSQNYFGQIRDWCREHGIASGGHLLIEENLTDHVPFYGDLMECTRMLDAPSIDCLTSVPAQVPWRVAKMAASCGELNGTALTMSETSDHVQRYRPKGDARPVEPISEEQIRGTCNRQILSGINTITSYYSFAGLTTKQLRRINEWVGRCCTMLRGGRLVTELGVLYPVHSVWSRFRPTGQGATDSPEAARVQEVFNSTSEALFRAQRNFLYLDARTLAEGQVRDGRLHHGDLSWSVVLLPAADTLPVAAWENLLRLWESGGVVIAVGALPANTDTEFPSPDVQRLAGEVFGAGREARVTTNAAGGVGVFLPEQSVGLLPVVLDGILEKDLWPVGEAPFLRMTHRRIEGQDVYFCINDGAAPKAITVQTCAQGPCKVWDPATGQSREVTGDVELALEPYGGAFITCESARRPRRRAVTAGGLPGLSLSALPAVEPTVGKGEFVRADLTRTADGAAWTARATLTKSDVDTHLFMSFRYPQKLDLTGVHSLAVTTAVPEGQRTRAQILVILRDEDGADYIASTSRQLAASGEATDFVPMSAFTLAGWSKDPDGELDLAGIEAVSVGWGGYFGKEGEVVEFTLRLPQAARVGE